MVVRVWTWGMHVNMRTPTDVQSPELEFKPGIELSDARAYPASRGSQAAALAEPSPRLVVGSHRCPFAFHAARCSLGSGTADSRHFASERKAGFCRTQPYTARDPSLVVSNVPIRAAVGVLDQLRKSSSPSSGSSWAKKSSPESFSPATASLSMREPPAKSPARAFARAP